MNQIPDECVARDQSQLNGTVAPVGPRKPCTTPIIRNRVPKHVERAVIELAIENPALGQLRVSQELLQRGIVVSSGGVRSIWLRNELETMGKRLKALEVRLAQEGIVLTEAQIVALEKAKSKREAAGEIETHHPG